MEGGRGPEFSISKQSEPTEHGFSEKRSARLREGKHRDNSQLAKPHSGSRHSKRIILPTQQRMPRASRTHVSHREKILAAHEQNAKAMIALIKTLGLLTRGSIAQEEQLMVEIRARQKIQEQLLNALVLEGRGELAEDTLPKELQDLIK